MSFVLGGVLSLDGYEAEVANVPTDTKVRKKDSSGKENLFGPELSYSSYES